MSDTDRSNPPVSDVIQGLLEDSGTNTMNVMALVGFVGPGRDDDVRLYPDIDFQRWLDIPRDAIRHHEPLSNFNGSRHGRMVLWVDSATMLEPMFDPDQLTPATFEGAFAGSWMSTWSLVPETRLVAAEMLDLVPHLAYDKKDT